MYKKAEASFWTTEELDLSKDLYDWNNHFNDNECHFVSHVLAFFAASDSIVNGNLVEHFSNEVQAAEAWCFYGFQIMMESIHSETYLLLTNTYIKDSAQHKYLFDTIDIIPCIKYKADWALQWISDEWPTFDKHLIAFVTVKGIFFSSFLCSHLLVEEVWLSYPQNRIKCNSRSLLSRPPTPEHFRPASS